jgi:predicted CopG family antitoxin
MASRNIAVQAAVYEALMREKRPGESFTELLRRLLDQREGLEELFGAWGRPAEGRSSRPRARGRPQGARR